MWMQNDPSQFSPPPPQQPPHGQQPQQQMMRMVQPVPVRQMQFTAPMRVPQNQMQMNQNPQQQFGGPQGGQQFINNNPVNMQPPQGRTMQVNNGPQIPINMQMTVGQAVQLGQPFGNQQNAVHFPQPTSTGSVLDKNRLDDLVQQVNKNTVLEENVKDALVEYADEFVDSLVDKACRIIRSRNSKKVEARDIEFVLENVYNIPTVPRASVHVFGGPPAADVGKEKNANLEAHKQRVALLKKQMKKI